MYIKHSHFWFNHFSFNLTSHFSLPSSSSLFRLLCWFGCMRFFVFMHCVTNSVGFFMLPSRFLISLSACVTRCLLSHTIASLAGSSESKQASERACYFLICCFERISHRPIQAKHPLVLSSFILYLSLLVDCIVYCNFHQFTSLTDPCDFMWIFVAILNNPPLLPPPPLFLFVSQPVSLSLVLPCVFGSITAIATTIYLFEQAHCCCITHNMWMKTKINDEFLLQFYWCWLALGAKR